MKSQANALPQLIARFALGIGFLLPVADRLGLMGAPGSGVNWGDWKHFTAYAHVIMSFLPESISNFGALIATIAEIIFGVCLLLGFKLKANAFGSAVLTLLFAFSMIISEGLLAPFKYPVFVFAGAALLLTSTEDPKWSIDSVLNEK
ncbi:DoxX family protein [Mucilaginibacter pallidiroseus]|uniref:DoxX family protein n=1 Tax=Mucilaginibacter pallidiroseus TaxID=2599295 RepID=A0A563TYH3_9SPHI|nr:DoxX family protein [Mucilaginibacter pallidiroseus]TWR24404.1 DoxX family protein [Mucilaginibacter pallidiroseus]